MNPVLFEIIAKYTDTFEIEYPDSKGVCIFKTEKENVELNKAIYTWLNRRAGAFGLEGPYSVKWIKL